MSEPARRLALIVMAIATLIFAAPVAASEPVAAPTDARITSETFGDPAPAGVAACDVRLSRAGGPLFDENFSVRAWEPFIVWGFGYAAGTTVFYDFFSPEWGTFTFSAVTNASGEFSQRRSFAPGSDIQYPDDWSLTAEPAGGGCIDGIALRVEAPYPFTDIDGFEEEIAWLHREGITGGCSTTRFCPNNGVSRGQMAAFLTRALDIPATSVDYFDDDDGTLFEGDINRLAAAGITGGCADRRYCPSSLVTRQQMASFLTRAFSLPSSNTNYFGDDGTSIHENDINALAASGITGGCASGRYCPRSNVTREQMAAFLFRAFN